MNDAFRLLCACNLAYGVSEDADSETRFAITPPILSSEAIIAELRRTAGFDAARTHTRQSPERGGIDAFVCAEGEDDIILAFRGTLPMRLVVDAERARQTLWDWWNNVRAALVAGSRYGVVGHVHEGYALSLENLWNSPGGVGTLLPRIASAKCAGKRLFLTGHSKGGAVAQLAALRMAMLGQHELLPDGVYTFGAPRAGNQAFAHAFDRLFGARAVRCEYADDLVPHLPPAEAGWFGWRAALASAMNDPSTQPLEPALFGSAFDSLVEIGGYESAGRLWFIDWEGQVREQDTPALAAERSERLLSTLASKPALIARAHLPMRGYGYMDCLGNPMTAWPV